MIYETTAINRYKDIKMVIVTLQNAIQPHNGAVTHHHDQVITLHNFNIVSVAVSKIKNEMRQDIVNLFFIFSLKLLSKSKLSPKS